MVCFSPDSAFRPGSKAEFYARVKTTMPFEVSEQDFSCYPSHEGLVGWLILEKSSETQAAVRTIRRDRGFRLLSVGRFTIPDRESFVIAQRNTERRDM